MNETRSLEVVLQRLTPMQQKVAALLLQGATVKDAAETNGLHRTTVHHWCRMNPTFQSALKEARRIQAEWLADETRTMAGEAMAQVRRTLTDASISDSVRLRAALAIIDRAALMEITTEPEAVTEAKVRALRKMIRESEAIEARRELGLEEVRRVGR